MSGGGRGVGVVIGASAGIGRATAERLAPRVDRLYALSRSGAEANADGTVALTCDVRSRTQVHDRLAEIRADAPVAFVVNCAGVGFYAPLDGDYSAQWEEIVATNLTGLVNVLSCVYAVARDTRDLVQLGSMAANRPSRTPGNALYSATKAAGRIVVEDFRSMLRAHGNPMRVSLVSPGFVEGTRFGERFFDHAPKAARDLYGGRRYLRPAQVAEVVASTLALDRDAEAVDILIRSPEQPD